jgi:tetratricopeptide (TPR) repeat protein
VAAARGLRGPDPLGRVVVAAALGGFAYWGVHGSVDWFWEFAGLGAPAFALLGLACALVPRAPAVAGPASRGVDRGAEASSASGWWRSAGIRRAAVAAGVCAAVLAALSLTAPWLSQLEIESAARIWTKSPQTAYARLNDAARLNPLSDEPYLVAGSIALRFGENARAGHEFVLALERSPGDAYATLERGAIASTEGDRARALTLLERAARLDPRDPLTLQALRLAGEGKRVSVEELNRSILRNAQQLE